MSKFFTTLAATLLLGFSTTSYAQFSIRRNATNTLAVDILYKAPSMGQGTHPVQYFQFALQIPNPHGATFTATFTPAAPLAALAGYQLYTGTDYGNSTFAWASTGTPTYANTYNFTSSEVVMGTVTFSANASGAIVNAVDYEDGGNYWLLYGGPGTQAADWVLLVDPSGTDILGALTNNYTDYSNLFYQSAASGGVAGSSAPYTTNENGGYTSYKMALSGTPLPLALTSFTATADKCDVTLNWSTANEENFDHFDVEYSADGRSYKKLGSVSSSHRVQGSMYTYHTAQSTGTGYYRLVMTDIDGSYSISNVATVRTDCNGAGISWSLYPNPVTAGSNVHMQLTAGMSMGYAHVVVADLMGHLVTDKQWQVQPGANQYELGINDIPAGTYMIQVYDDNERAIGTAQKLIIM